MIHKLYPKILCIEYDILMWKNSPVYTAFHTLEIAHVQSFVQSVFLFFFCAVAPQAFRAICASSLQSE